MKTYALILLVTLSVLEVGANPRTELSAVRLAPGERAAQVAARVPGAPRWLGLGETLVIEAGAAALAGLHRPVEALTVPAGAELALVLSKHGGPLPPPLTGAVLARHSGFAFAALGTPRRDVTDFHVAVRPVPWGTAVVEERERTAALAHDPALDALLAKITPEGVRADTQHLVDFKTRNTLTKGYEDAAAWCESEFKAAGFVTSRSNFPISGRTAQNVVAELPGQPGVDDVYVVGGHLDSINFTDGASYAPGADDNGSGSACVLQIAKALAGTHPRATIRCMLYGGEEEDLLGSKAYVAGLSSAELARIKGVVITDMAGYHKNPAGVTVESRDASKALSDLTADMAGRYTPIKVEQTWDAWGSDHVPFLDAGVPTVLTIEIDYPVNGNEHSPRDTMDLVDAEQAAAIARTDLAVLATLAGLGTPPRR